MDETAAHRIVLSLYPVRRRVREARSSGRADIVGRQNIDGGADPAAIDFMIRVDECEDAAPSLARRAVAQLGNGPCCTPQDRGAGLDADLAGSVGRLVVDDEYFKKVTRIVISRHRGQTSSQSRRVVLDGNDKGNQRWHR